jgi:hypothetical protein
MRHRTRPPTRPPRARATGASTCCRDWSSFYRSGRFKTDNLVEQMLSVRGESDLIILDDLHYLDDGDDDEIRAMRRTVKAVSDTIQDARTPVIAIAPAQDGREEQAGHPAHRRVPRLIGHHEGRDDGQHAGTGGPAAAHAVDRRHVHARVEKTGSREQNFTAILGFDLRSNSYERGYELGRLLAGGTKWEAVPIGELPWWAVNERRRMSWPS